METDRDEILSAMQVINDYRARREAVGIVLSPEEEAHYTQVRDRVEKFLSTKPGFLQIRYGYRLGNARCAIEDHLTAYVPAERTVSLKLYIRPRS
ncbi:MAG TPA: hypothetical protein VLG09_03745 [Candidatus Saccharimonadales bacterium]|nr:hypothetical protein [Candidatus Saccharimonadales bacterium]